MIYVNLLLNSISLIFCFAEKSLSANPWKFTHVSYEFVMHPAFHSRDWKSNYDHNFLLHCCNEVISLIVTQKLNLVFLLQSPPIHVILHCMVWSTIAACSTLLVSIPINTIHIHPPVRSNPKNVLQFLFVRSQRNSTSLGLKFYDAMHWICSHMKLQHLCYIIQRKLQHILFCPVLH